MLLCLLFEETMTMIYEQHLLVYEMSQKGAAQASSLTPVTLPTERSKMRHFPLTSWSFSVWQWRLRQDDFAPFAEQEMPSYKPVLWVISPLQLYVLQLAERGTRAAQGGDYSSFRSVRNLITLRTQSSSALLPGKCPLKTELPNRLKESAKVWSLPWLHSHAQFCHHH